MKRIEISERKVTIYGPNGTIEYMFDSNKLMQEFLDKLIVLC